MVPTIDAITIEAQGAEMTTMLTVNMPAFLTANNIQTCMTKDLEVFSQMGPSAFDILVETKAV